MAERSNQKARTRSSIIAACAELFDAGDELTMESIADHAGISRATIYRYFATVNDVVWQVINERLEHESLPIVAQGGPSLIDRAITAERVVNDSMFARPQFVRLFEVSTLQRVVDGTALPDDRPTRRLRFIDEALAPYADELGPERSALVRHALALALGPEALITLLDACRLDEPAARRVTEWTVRAIVNQALSEVDSHAVPG